MKIRHWLPNCWNRLSLSFMGLILYGLIPVLLADDSGPKKTGWQVQWESKGEKKSGRLQFNQTSRKMELVSSDQKQEDLGTGLLIHPDPENPKKPLVHEYADLAVAILGYQERLTGRVESIVPEKFVRWTIPGQSNPVEWPLGIASAWAFHPSVNVALFEDFEKSEIPGTFVSKSIHSQAGDRVFQASSGLKLKTTDPSSGLTGARLIQLAFFDDGSGGSLKLTLNGAAAGKKSGDRSLELKSSLDQSQWMIEFADEPKFASTPVPRKSGWHWLTISIASDRTRICIDELVMSESRTEWFPNQLISGLEISSTAESKLLIDAVGIYQYDRILGPVQRPLQDDLIQMNGGHEWLGSSNLKELPTRWIRAILPKNIPAPGRWAQGPVVRVTFQSQGESLWKPDTDLDYLKQLGLLSPPVKGFDCVEGALVGLDENQLSLELSQGGKIVVDRSQCLTIEPVNASGLKVLDVRPHHLGDELDLKVIPPEPEGGTLKMEFQLVGDESKYQTQLCVDVLQVLGANIAPFVESIKRGELITEVWLNNINLGTLNRHIEGRNETPERIRFPIAKDVLRSGINQLEFRQKGQKNDPNYLDDLSILGVRLYRMD